MIALDSGYTTADADATLAILNALATTGRFELALDFLGKAGDDCERIIALITPRLFTLTGSTPDYPYLGPLSFFCGETLRLGFSLARLSLVGGSKIGRSP